MSASSCLQICFAVIFWGGIAAAQPADPASPEWPTLPDDSCLHAGPFLAIPLQYAVFDATTAQPIEGAYILGEGVGKATDSRGQASLRIPLKDADKTLTVYACGYEPICDSILKLAMDFPYYKVYMQPAHPVPEVPPVHPDSILPGIRHAARSVETWNSIWLLENTPINRETACSGDASGWLYAPKGFAVTSPADPFGWQVRLASVYTNNPKNVPLAEILTAWQQHDLLLIPDAQWAASSFSPLPACWDGTTAMPRFRWQLAGMTGEIQAGAGHPLVIQQATWDSPEGTWTQHTFWQYTDGHLYPVRVQQRRAGQHPIFRDLAFLPDPDTGPFRSRLESLPQHIREGKMRQYCNTHSIMLDNITE